MCLFSVAPLCIRKVGEGCGQSDDSGMDGQHRATHIRTLELPEGMKLDRSSYEVLLRYMLLDVVAA
jgi:hypothetical protein